MKSKFQKSVLIPIDIQQGFKSPTLGRRNNPNLEQNITDIFRAWRKADLPILHVKHHSSEPNSPLAEGSDGVEFMPCATPEVHETVIVKSVHSAFIGTSLMQDLIKLETRNVFLMGLCTDHCVTTTARMAANYGFNVHVITDACATFERHNPQSGETFSADIVHRVHLASIDKQFVELISVKELTCQL